MFGTQNANTKHSLNRLTNGGFYRVMLPVDETLTTVVGAGTQPRSAYIDRENAAASPAYRIPTARPSETAIANWYIYGVAGTVDIRPTDPNNQNVPVRGQNGPTPVRVTTFETGDVVVEQDIAEFWGLLDRDLTLSFFVGQGNRAIALQVEAEYGSGVVVLDTLSSKTFPAGNQRKIQFTAPYDATKFTLRFRLTGVPDASVYLGEAMLQLGKVAKPRYTDDIAASERPRGACVLFVGDTVPPGYIVECEAEDKFLYPTAGDALADGLTRGGDGGDTAHDHTGKTGNRTRSTTLLHDGSSQVDHHHRHTIEEAEIDPPWTKVLLIRKV